MIKTTLRMFIAITFAIAFTPAQAQDDLIYVAVKPCRIVNTQKGLAQPVPKNDHANFLVSGTAGDLFDQGGQQAGGCPAPRPGQNPAAIAAYVVAVPAPSSTGPGILTAYSSDLNQPPVGAAATVNFEQGKIVGNTTIISICYSGCPHDGQFAILARDTDEHVIIDVQGYFYPAATQTVWVVSDAVFVSLADTSASAFVECPDNLTPVGGGGRMNEESLSPGIDWSIANSYPILIHSVMPIIEGPNPGWNVDYTRVGEPDEGELRAHVICAPY